MLRLAFPYLLFGAIVLIVVLDRAGPADVVDASGPVSVAAAVAPIEPIANAESSVGRDPVCGMEVAFTLAAVRHGERYPFCSERCRETFLADPAAYVAEHCLVCRVDDGRLVVVGAVGEGEPELTWQGTTRRFCSAEHRDAFAHDPAGYFMHSMWGIPGWLYTVSVALILILSFGLFEVVARWNRAQSRSKPPPARASLFRIPGVERVLRSPAFRAACQVAFVAAFGVIVLAGLYGDQLPGRNVAPLLTWTIWWGGLVVVILFAGKAWCYVCPWEALTTWLERLGERWGGLGLGLRWPKRLRNVWLATLFFVGLTWLELGFGITMNPRATAWLGLGMVAMALVTALVFERRAFCRYACLVGRVSGLYALFSAFEVRPADREVCRGCATKDCYHGNERGVGCPTGVFPGALRENTYCIDCMECLRTCPDGNMVVRARPWGADLAEEGRPRRDEAYLALLMLAITGFHGLTMTAMWRDGLAWLEDALGLPYLAAFSVAMALLMLLPVLIYAGLIRLTVWLGTGVSYRTAFVRFAYAVLPIALFYHLAHNLEHLLMEGQKVIPLLSNPFGFAPGEVWNVLGIRGQGAWNLFGTADWTLAPLVGLSSLWGIQVLLVLVGHVYSLWISDRTARRLYPAPGAALRSQLPMLVGMVLFSVFSLWLLKLPMEMRTSAM